MLAVHTPFAKVFAIVAEQPIAILACSRTGTANYLATIEMRGRRARSYLNRATIRETSQ
jgi:hypothetical protein